MNSDTVDDNKILNEEAHGIRGLRRLTPFLRPYIRQLLGALIALVIAAGSVLAIGQAIRRVVDNGFVGGTGFVDQYFIALFGIVVVLAAATFGRYYFVTWLGERVIADLRSQIYSHILKLGPSFFEQRQTGEVLSRLTADTTLIQSVIGATASVALRNILMFFGGSILLLITSPKLTGIVFVMIPIVVLPIVIFGRRVRRLSRDSQDRVAAISKHAGESLGAIQVIQAFCQEKRDAKRFRYNTESAFKIAVKRTVARSWLTALVMLLVFGAVDGVVWVGANDVISGEMTAGQLTAFVFYAIVVAGAFGSLSEVYGDLQRAAGASERLIELLDEKPDVVISKTPIPIPTKGSGKLVFEDISFCYPSRPDDPALENFGVTIEGGSTVALVGPSGAGKSTVFQLLLRFFDPQYGAILLDNADIKMVDLMRLREQIGIVHQEPVIFAASVSENIRFGNPNASADEIREAAAAANAIEFIEKLPSGFDTWLGERGVRLSGGQRQRIAIARTILKAPSILLLDEATSALDSESERMVQIALDTLVSDRTTIVIAHRLATVLKADSIIVLDDGNIVDTGRHDELLGRGGVYARLAELQFDNDKLFGKRGKISSAL